MRWLRGRSADDGFTVIEALVAVTILAIAIVLTIQPVMAALGRTQDARVISVAENLAQAEVESIRALEYVDVGVPGYTPSGVLTETQDRTIENRLYTIETSVRYAGSVTGLDVIPQGGDGVEGVWDPGVDYKVVIVTVTAEGRERDPIIMETIVSPPNIGAHEGIANARVTVAAYEPFDEGEFPLPKLQIHAPPSAPIKSGEATELQVFPAIPPDTYSIEFDSAGGWVFHPEDISAGLASIEVVSGSTTDTALRVYKPATLLVTVIDDETDEPITDARVKLVHSPTATQTDYDPGEYEITGLIPDAYDIEITATGYDTFAESSVNIPEDYPDLIHELEVELNPGSEEGGGGDDGGDSGGDDEIGGGDGATVVAVTFTVTDNTGRPVHGATVSVVHPVTGLMTVTTNESGEGILDLEEGTVFNAEATTDWGHGPTDTDFDPESSTSVALQLTRPDEMGTYVLKGGSNAEFAYQPWGGSWKIMPANVDDEASFVGPEGWYRATKRCLSNGDVLGTKWLYVDEDENRSTTIWGYCP